MMSFPRSKKQSDSHQEDWYAVQPSAPPMPQEAVGTPINFQPHYPPQYVSGSESANQAPFQPLPQSNRPVVSYVTPVQGQVQYANPPPTVPLLAQQVNTATVLPPAKIEYYPGMPHPVAPPGYVYVYHEEVDPVAVCILICFFPWSLPVVCCMMRRYWELVPVGGQILY